MSARVVTKAAGCYKCGKSDHWARDCKAPQSEWISKNGGAAKPQAADHAAGTAEQAENDPLNTPDAAAADGRATKDKPKVDLELLKQPDGLPFLYHNFQPLFAKQFKGRGHEASDLRRLLEMYKRWQERIFPSLPFDEFIDRVEDLGRTKMVQLELQEMRTDMLQIVKNSLSKQVVAEARDTLGEEEDAPIQLEMEVEEEEELELNDDELMELAALPMEPVARRREVPIGDDELIALALETQEDDGFLAGIGFQAADMAAPQATATATHMDADEELLRLAAGTTAEEVEDEELLALAAQMED